MSDQYIIIKGAREHNLKNIDVKIPIDKLTVITGLSGSGKSSLAFDTLYAEGQRRYVESLSTYARQFLGVMSKPDVDKIQGLSPAISIEQKSVSKNPRSTVGTVTEVYDYLRLLFARIGVPHCPNCGKIITPQSAEEIVKIIMHEKEGTKIQILAPIVRGRKGAHENLFKELHLKGFARARVDSKIIELEGWEKIKLEKQYKHAIDVIIDRLVKAEATKKAVESRLADSVETALALAEGLVLVIFGEGKNAKEKIFSQHNACIECGISFEELQPRMFSFNSPFGACPECHGLGVSRKFSEDLAIPDKNLSIMEGAIKPWQNIIDSWRKHQMDGLCKHYHFDLWAPWKELPETIRHIVLYGSKDPINFHWESHSGDTTSAYKREFEGIIPQLYRLYEQTESQYRREEMEKFMHIGMCEVCRGKRLKPEVLAVSVGGKNICEVTELSIDSLEKFIKCLKLSKTHQEIAEGIRKEIINRLRFLIDVGLDYLTLSREAGTLAGGEAQRIRLATQIGSELRGVLYILDEPSIGLHQRDNQKLILMLKKLRDIGNTVVVVEHDKETILSADYVLDLGLGAGVHGGHVIFEGKPDDLKKSKKSITGQYLSGVRSIDIPTKRRRAFKYLEIIGAKEHNLKNIDVKIPLGVFSCVTGVSGSGKSTLVNDIIYKALYKIFWASSELPGKHKAIKGYGEIDQAIIVDQSPIGRTPRSNPATYIGVFSYIRDLFASTKEARMRGYKPGRFSFNVAGGRCGECEGDGVKKIEMHFLPDIYVTCEKCKGTRFNEETLNVQYKGKNIAEVLRMTVEEALEFFKNIPRIKNKLETLNDVGLGYIALGQSSTTLSGGEAQRIKLTSELSKKGSKNIYILDEPTTGLHFEDVKKLLGVINRLVDKGNTALVIEHNLDVIKSADWVIDLGPEGGDKGGRVIAEGTPEKIVKCARWSYTGKYLKEMLKCFKMRRREAGHSFSEASEAG